MRSIKEIIQKFSLRVPPEKLVAETIELFLKEKNIRNPSIKASLRQHKVFIQSDPYLKLFIKTNEQELLAYLKQKAPQYKISGII